MYDSEDVNTLTSRFMEVIEQRKNKKENNFNSSIPLKTLEKSQTRKLSRDEEIRQKKFESKAHKLYYPEFLKIILDFQL